MGISAAKVAAKLLAQWARKVGCRIDQVGVCLEKLRVSSLKAGFENGICPISYTMVIQGFLVGGIGDGASDEDFCGGK